MALNRRQFLIKSLQAVGLCTLPFLANSCTNEKRAIENIQHEGNKKNVIFIIFDDLNDWCSPFGGYPGVYTPNLQKLSEQSVSFQNAFCSVPVCGASRASFLSGLSPMTTGFYRQNSLVEEYKKNQQYFQKRKIPLKTLPAMMKSLGYTTFGAGKIYHNAGYEKTKISGIGDYEKEYWDDFLTMNYSEMHPLGFDLDFPKERNSIINRFGPKYSDNEDLMPDVKTAKWASNKLRQSHSKPFFLTVGFHKPHLSWFVPQRFYDLYPLESLRVPDLEIEKQDLNDLPEIALQNFRLGGKDHQDLTQENLVRNAIQAYLASISFADECFGRVLDTLKSSSYAKDTIIVVLSDHGWFLGEKLGWRKFKLWEKATRVPLMVSVPGMTNASNCDSVVSTLDIFPTIMDLLGIPIPDYLEGRSFKDLVYAPENFSDRFALSSWLINNKDKNSVAHTIRTKDWRYIRYPDNSEELYEHKLGDVETRNERLNLLYSRNINTMAREVANKHKLILEKRLKELDLRAVL